MLTLLLLATALQVPAQTPPATEKPAPEKKICRRGAATGSIMTMRTCHTAADWAKIDADAADATAEALRQRANAGTSMSSTRQ